MRASQNLFKREITCSVKLSPAREKARANRQEMIARLAANRLLHDGKRVGWAETLRMIRRVFIVTWTTLAVAASAYAQSEGNEPSHAAVLLDSNRDLPRAARVEAARRLVQRDTPADRQALAQALQERSNQAIQSAAANAIADAPSPD